MAINVFCWQIFQRTTTHCTGDGDTLQNSEKEYYVFCPVKIVSSEWEALSVVTTQEKKGCKKHRQNISVMFWDSEFPTGNVPKHKSYIEYVVGRIVRYNLILTAIRKSLAIWLARKTVYLCNMQNKTLSQILFLRMYCHFIRT